MGTIILGNLISLAAACFMAASCLAKDNRRVFFCQFMECAILAVSSVVFGSLSGALTMALSAARNLITSRGKLTRSLTVFFFLAAVVGGLLINTRGAVGLLPVIATAEYTICSYRVRSVLGTKYSIFVNVLFWVVYSFLILDFSTAISDSVILVIDGTAILRAHRERRAEIAAETPAE
ncbi:YgjV family protein [Dysosmobacter sp.]|uniref:YgjV family protein n=1 Tax=Dysosmobacter sp. TaxID=2591382 RepID=UPI002A8CB88B|nr:YgjV family protein [Dysosmobacter sp.]MDY3280826.1 YgjV family protein [Dysosmobacter sp.]